MCALNPLAQLAGVRLERQSIEFRALHSSVLDQNLEGAAHPFGFQEVDGRIELRALWFEPADHLFDTQPHQETHLIRKTCNG